MIDLPSPNWDDRPAGVAVDMLILHYTGMQSGAAAIARLRDPAARVSSHYVVEEDGAVYRLVAEDRRAWHAGISFWRGRRALNDVSVGIEIVNPGHEWGYRRFPDVQMTAVEVLCREIVARHGIVPERVLGHSDVAPDRKQDPGELFDWRGLARSGLGVWPDDIQAEPLSVADAQRKLRAFGYECPQTGAMDPATRIVVTAFQRHFRPENVDGLLDAETCARLSALTVGA